MKKQQTLFIVMLILLILSGIVVHASAEEGSLANKPRMITGRGIIQLKLNDLLQANEHWLSQDGWFHLFTKSLGGEPETFHFSEQDHWFEMKEGRLTGSLLIVTAADTGEEVQRFIINENGIRGELVALRKLGHEAPENMQPAAIDPLWQGTSQIKEDLERFKRWDPFIDSMLMTETDELIHLRIEMTHHGEPNRMEHGLPPGRNPGVIHVYSYEKANGNRVKSSMGYLNLDLTAESPTVYAETAEFFGELPEELRSQWASDLTELGSFIQLFEP